MKKFTSAEYALFHRITSVSAAPGEKWAWAETTVAPDESEQSRVHIGGGASFPGRFPRWSPSGRTLAWLGADENGEQLISSLQKAGVSTSLIRRESGSFTSVGNVQIETGEGGQSQNRIVVVPGANHQWNRDTVDRLCGLVSEYDMLLLQLEIPMWVNEELASAARSAGVPVLLNPAPADKLSRRLLE